MAKISKLTAIVSSPAATGLDDHIAVRIARITEIVTRIATRTIESRWGLSNTDLRLLNILDNSDPVSVSEISRRSHVDKAWVSRSLRDLDRRKLVVRHAHPLDTRVSLIEISAKGQALLDEVRPHSLRNEIDLLKGIDARRLKRFLEALESNADTLLRRLEAARNP
jgi:DNA-binding MarR family transcriptional regulator